MEKIWEALYCPCVHESSYGTISLHRTDQGAKKAIEEHKAKRRKEWIEYKDRWSKEDNVPIVPFGANQDWMVIETEIKD